MLHRSSPSTEVFDMTKRIHITTDFLKAHFTTATVYAQRGAELYQQVERLRAEARADRQSRKAKSGPQRRHKQRRERLRDTDPWGCAKPATVRAPMSASRPYSIDVVMVCWFTLLPPLSCLAQDAQGSDRVAKDLCGTSRVDSAPGFQ